MIAATHLKRPQKESHRGTAIVWRPPQLRLALRASRANHVSSPPSRAILILPKRIEPLRRKFVVAHRVLDILVPEVVLHRARVLSVVRQFISARVPQHMRMHRKRKLRTLPVRAIILRNPATVIGAARSVMNRNRLSISSRLSLRNARSSPPPSGCTDGVPFLTRRTWSSPCPRSIMSHRSAHASAGRSPCRNAMRIIVASRCP
jgi:hypothetical protein